MPDSEQRGLEMHSRLQRAGEPSRKAIVAADDAEHLFAAGYAVLCELIGEREERQIARIGEEKSAHADRHVPQPFGCANAVEPISNRFRRKSGGDAAIPALFAQAERPCLGPQAFLQLHPSMLPGHAFTPAAIR